MSLEIEKIILSGPANEGLVLLGRIIAEAGLVRNLEVTYLPAYGPTPVGEDVECTIILSTAEVGSPVVGVPDVVFASGAQSFHRLNGALKAGGLVVFDASRFEPFPGHVRDDVRPIGVPAAELFNTVVPLTLQNASLVGAFVAYSRLLDVATVEQAISRVCSTGSLPAEVTARKLKGAVQKGARFVRDKGYRSTRYRYSIFMA